MKTKDLIALLQKVDPSGELHVCLQDNTDVYDAHQIPAFWDGRHEILVRNPDEPFFNVQGGIINGVGNKVILSGLSIEEALIEKPDMPVLILGGDVTGEYRRRVEKWRDEAYDIIAHLKDHTNENSC